MANATESKPTKSKSAQNGGQPAPQVSTTPDTKKEGGKRTRKTSAPIQTRIEVIGAAKDFVASTVKRLTKWGNDRPEFPIALKSLRAALDDLTMAQDVIAKVGNDYRPPNAVTSGDAASFVVGDKIQIKPSKRAAYDLMSDSDFAAPLTVQGIGKSKVAAKDANGRSQIFPMSHMIQVGKTEVVKERKKRITKAEKEAAEAAKNAS